jgi:hypothetical protein
MSALEVGGIVFLCVFSGAMVGMFLRTVLPERHLQGSATDVIKLATGLVVTMTGLVLGMLVSTALTFYNLQRTELQQACAKLILMDRILAEYGEDTRQARSALREVVAITLDNVWPEDQKQRSNLKPVHGMSNLYQELQALAATSDKQRFDKEQALSIATQLYETHWLMFIESGRNSSSGPLMTIIVSWLTAIFISFGLLSERNATVFAALVIAAIAVSAAIFIIEEMYDPYGGMFRLSSAPLVKVLDQIGH